MLPFLTHWHRVCAVFLPPFLFDSARLCCCLVKTGFVQCSSLITFLSFHAFVVAAMFSNDLLCAICLTKTGFMQCSSFVFLKRGPNLSIFPAGLSLSDRDPGNDVFRSVVSSLNKQRETGNEMDIPLISMSRKTGFTFAFVPKRSYNGGGPECTRTWWLWLRVHKQSSQWFGMSCLSVNNERSYTDWRMWPQTL